MKKIITLLFITLTCIVNNYAQVLRSPAGNFEMNFKLQTDGTPVYQLAYKGKEIIKTSRLGLELKNDSLSLLNNFEIEKVDTASFDETWKHVWGEVTTIRNHYNEMAGTLHQKMTDRVMVIRFRLFKDGLGFR